MSTAYELGYLAGTFLGGCLCGLFPLIVSIMKKRTNIGVILAIACGLLGLMSPVVSLAVGVISGIALLFAKKNA